MTGWIQVPRPLRLDAARPAMLVVIHHQDLTLTGQNVQIAIDGRADGVFLIHHGGANDELLSVTDAIRERWPDLWIGVNLLGLPAPTAFEQIVGHDIDGLWTDASGIDREGSHQAHGAVTARERTGFAGHYFGGVEFKYQPSLGNHDEAASIASGLMDVICTSGAATGQPADLDKLRRMRTAAAGTPLAVASGVTPENASALVGVVDAVLVATGISHDFHHLDPDRVNALRHTLG